MASTGPVDLGHDSERVRRTEEPRFSRLTLPAVIGSAISASEIAGPRLVAPVGEVKVVDIATAT